MTERQIGHYELRGIIGVGGMGEVYRAFDPQLRREVAVKMLPPDLTSDPDRVARFEREARVLASLNHPNIATIHGVEQSTGTRGIVMELVEGETLAERLARTGRLGLAEALAVARQVADALDAAHEKGIVHRDLKPANIKITPQGIVKVLDFGLATTKSVERPNDTHAATALTGATRAGVIVGTVAYMSPEQARGQSVDKRADVWAFGCVLYEMITGRAAFGGDTPSDVIAAILDHPPDWSALPAATPAALRRLLSRCLDKDARRRCRDIGDARTEIEDMLSGSSPGASPTSTPHGTMAAAFVRRKRERFMLATALVLAAVASSVLVLRPPAVPEQFRQNEMNPPSGYSFAPLMQGGAPALSPDGSTIAFVAQGSAGRSLWVQSVDAFDARALTGTDGAAAPFWSPGGDELAFIADESLKTVRLDGGAPRVLVTGIRFTSQGALPGTWNSDGTILFRLKDETLWSVSAKGGEPTVATTRDAAAMEQDHYGAFFLPDGRHFILLARKGAELRLQVAVAELGSNSRIPLLNDVTAAQYAPGRNGRSSHLVFVRGRRLIAQPFDDEERKLTGSEVTLADDVGVTLGGGLGDFSVSAAVLAYRRAPAGPQADMAWYDRNGEKVGTIGNRRGHPRNVIRISPSGRSAVFTRQGPTTQEVWIADVESGHTEQLTPNGRSPVWSPDESEIAFLRQDENDSGDRPTITIYRKKLDGGAEVPVWSRYGILSINDWSGDGQYLLFATYETTTSRLEHWLLREPLNPSATPEPVRFETGGRYHPSFVPSEGPPLAITTDGVIVHGMPGANPGPWRVGSEGASHARWRRNGRELFFHDEGYLQVVERMSSATDFKFGGPRRLFPLPLAFQIAQGQAATGWDVTPDGQRFLVVNPPSDTPGPIQIVTNWDVE